ncbi:MAG: sugar phosphate nucleotidyltransferase [Patescibacteria group bacterium]
MTNTKKKLKVVILAAGFGERLTNDARNDNALEPGEKEKLFLPNGEIKPKALLEINGREIASRLVDQLKEIPDLDIKSDVYLVVNSKYHETFCQWAIRQDIGLNQNNIINNGVESPSQRQGAVADLGLAVAEGGIEAETLVLSSDTLFDEFKLKDLIAARQTGADNNILPVYQEAGAIMHRRAHVEFDSNGQINRFEEKRRDLDPESTYWASPAIYLYSEQTIKHDLPKYLAENKGQLTKLDAPGQFNEYLCSINPEIRALPIKGKRFDIGNLEGFRGADAYFRERETEIRPEGRRQ